MIDSVKKNKEISTVSGTKFNLDYLTVDLTVNRVPTSSGNHGKPGKSPKKVPCMEKTWNLKKKLNNHRQIMEFYEII